MSATLVVMAAGLGSRYGGIKQMEGVGPNGEILLEYAVFDALRAGFDHTVIILRPDIYDDFRRLFGRRLEAHTNVSYAIQDYASLPSFYTVPPQRAKPFGTTHAVLCAREHIHGAFAVLNADDYYGSDAFLKIRGALAGLTAPERACMVAYKLGNTVSEAGTVTRGVCAVENGALASIRETHEIALLPDGSIRSPEALSAGGLLDGACPVSMNFWGFHEGALEDMERYFHDFLRALPADKLKAECLVPEYVGDRVREGRLQVNVLTTDASWFGMTYKADWAITAACLKDLHAQGVYPPTLFD